jgi:hypothetical protein
MSDSELLKLKAPYVVRQPGRPKEQRYKESSDYYAKRTKKREWDGVEETEELSENRVKKYKKKVSRCGECKILGHSTTQCKKKHVDTTTELPEF